MATVERTPRQRRHQKTATDFKRWLARNPNASLKRRIGAFNAIADSNFAPVQKRIVQKKKAKVK